MMRGDAMKTPIATALLLAVLGLGPSVATPRVAHADELETCGKEGNITLLCGPHGVEDMQWIPGTNWVIGIGAKSDIDPGGLRLLDIEHKTWLLFYPNPAAKASPDKSAYPQCPGAPDPSMFEAHGISLMQTGPEAFQLLVVNHGREAVEVFTVTARSGNPALTWIGCVLMGDKIYMNSVTFLPEGGFAATKFFDPSDKRPMLSIFSGGTTGGVYEWHAETGIAEVPGTDLAGANGIVASPDGKWLYVAAWGSNQVVRFSRDPEAFRNGGRKKDVVDLDFAPDNLHWAPDGSILVAGQHGTRGPKSPVPDFKGWAVVKLDPETLAITKIAEGPTDSILQTVSNAIDIDGTLWLGAYAGDKIGYMPTP